MSVLEASPPSGTPASGGGLGWLVGARLLLAGTSLAVAVALDRLDGGEGPGIWGVYWTIVGAFGATIVAALQVARTRNPARFATLQIGIDVAVVTLLVYFSGGRESVFTFLYALVVLYGSLVLDRGGVAISVGMAALGYGFVVFGVEAGWIPAPSGDRSAHPLSLVAAYWAFHAGGLLVLAMLANTLSAELRRTGAALDRKTSDLERLRDLHLRIVESLGSGLVTIDEAGVIMSFNPEAERITGVGAAEAKGRTLESILPGAMTLVEARSDEGATETSSGRGRIRHRNRRAEELFIGLAASPLLSATGGPAGHVVIFQDVTAIVSMEQDLRRSERLAAVGEMAARMAHEIRNPLASISGSVQLLQTGSANASAGGDPDPVQAKLMGIVVREVDRLNDLIHDFLRYSRPAPLELEPVSLTALLREVVAIARGSGASDLRVVVEGDESVVVLADADQIKSVVWNLWNNALEAMGGKGELRLRVGRGRTGTASQGEALRNRNAMGGVASGESRTPESGWFEVEDSGPGLSAEHRDRIFEPFFTTKQEGTGLGLATVQRIVEQHGGSIAVSSEVGRGTTFRVALPLRPEACA